MTKGEPPFFNLVIDQGRYFEAMSKDNEEVERIPECYSDEFADFVQNSIRKRKEDRWSMGQLLRHPWLKDAETYRKTWVDELKYT